jgi:hypothetical protein
MYFSVTCVQHVSGRVEVHIGIWSARPKAKKSLGTPRVRWEDNIKCVGVGSIDLTEDRDKWWFL